MKIRMLSSSLSPWRTVERGRRAVCASDGDDDEGTRPGGSKHGDQHGQSGLHIQETRTMKGSWGAGRSGDGDEEEGARPGASRHTDQHPCGDMHL